MKLFSRLFSLILPVIISSVTAAQPYIVDEIIGVVGKNQILYSDVEDQYKQYEVNGVKSIPSRCEIFEDMLAQKLLVNQAAVDSLVVEEGQVDMELNDRINYF